MVDECDESGADWHSKLCQWRRSRKGRRTGDKTQQDGRRVWGGSTGAAQQPDATPDPRLAAGTAVLTWAPHRVSFSLSSSSGYFAAALEQLRENPPLVITTACSGLHHPNWLADLRAAEHKLYSQNQEDGMLIWILMNIGVLNKYFVEV
jgi:hypothetical protein